ncbi:MAG: 3-deoxy-D-manno-octulosonic acid transferase, partial [Marinobacter sp.]
AWGMPVFSGPHVFNFETIFDRLIADQGVQMVEGCQDLAQAISRLMSDAQECKAYGQRALAVVNNNRGALDKVVEGIIERV